MKQVIFDTDIGIDDAMALLFLHFAHEAEVVAIVSGYGNASIQNTTANALYMKQLFNIDVPVFRGASGPLNGEIPKYPDFVHGENGLGDIDIPGISEAPESRDGAQAIVDIVCQNPGKITIVTVGRLTNIANALRLRSELPNIIKELIIMGGAFGFNGHRGNVSPVAEANIAGDPIAADIVFTSGIPTTVVGLDVTMEVIMEQAYFDALRRDAGKAGEFIYRISERYLDFHESSKGRRDCPVHDPSAVAFLLKPEIFSAVEAPVRVVTEGIAAGQTIWGERNASYEIDAWRELSSCKICTNVDGEELLHLYRDTLISAVD